MSPASSSWLLGAASGVSSLLSLIVHVVFLVVAFGIVRRHRPDAWGLVAAWAGASIALMLMHTVMNMLMPLMVGGSSSPDSFFVVSAATTGTFALLRAAVDLLLVLALVRLARGADAPRA